MFPFKFEHYKEAMADETVKLSARTWARAVDSINKDGYSDGVVDGQAASFQSSFDVGYEQGFEFGFKLGLQKAKIINTHQSSSSTLIDARRINCQICLNSNGANNENVVNLLNKQREKNNEYLKVMQ